MIYDQIIKQFLSAITQIQNRSKSWPLFSLRTNGQTICRQRYALASHNYYTLMCDTHSRDNHNSHTGEGAVPSLRLRYSHPVHPQVTVHRASWFLRQGIACFRLSLP
jgi:hypothetical protein